MATAVVLTVVMLSITAGLGAVALAEIPVASAVIGSYFVERRRRRRGQLTAQLTRATRR